eukprot:CAMPEP_0119352388 /NCGR_PEP_ID=MMETSP1334-20130426/1648_1 /TAXON_ID=127549 /ORGANISM="Calcidiscus leptoporus, Strain RCC1130" /LENGTH=60 /DNA_ID=CAMNT_0007365417 /DNA_START=96 /DNA_END=274 /DNA_ORIENTATION=-
MSARDRERMHKCLSKQAMLGQGPLSFEEILADPVNLHHFKRFCVQAISRLYLGYISAISR